MTEIWLKTYSGIHVKYPQFLSDFKWACIFLTDFWKILKLQTSWKSVKAGAELSHADTQTDMTRLIVAFHNSLNMSKNERKWWHKIAQKLTIFLYLISQKWSYNSQAYITTISSKINQWQYTCKTRKCIASLVNTVRVRNLKIHCPTSSSLIMNQHLMFNCKSTLHRQSTANIRADVTFKCEIPVVLHTIIKMGTVSQTQLMNILLLRSFIYVAYLESKSNYMFQPYEYLVTKELYLHGVPYEQEKLHVSTFLPRPSSGWTLIMFNLMMALIKRLKHVQQEQLHVSTFLSSPSSGWMLSTFNLMMALIKRSKHVVSLAHKVRCVNTTP